MQITKDDNNLIITVPLKQDITDPWSDEIHGQMDNIIGVITGDDTTFNYLIDRSYKDKGPDISTPFLYYDGEEKDFIKLCKKLDIQIERTPMCSKCGKALWGTFTIDDKGKPCCENCEEN